MEIETARQCRDFLAHRGPDASGEWVDRDKGIYLGHRRLSVIDLTSASDQPFTDGTRALIFNGEIYNFRSLRPSLESHGYRFRTGGDTETLFAVLTRDASAAVDLLDGMFAFVFWDGVEAVVAIDPFGEKPLYIAELEDGVALASEVGALAPFSRKADFLSDDHWAAFLSLGYLPTPHTAFPNVRKLPSASITRIRNGRAGEPRKYWIPPIGDPGRGSPSPLQACHLERIRERLVESLERRLVSDAPLSLFLSSGTDSGLVAALVSRELERKVDAVTVVVESGTENDESAAARAVADHLELPHETIPISEKNPPLNASSHLQLFRQPNDGIAAESIRIIARAVQPRSKVVLSGVGGDELFLGYTKYSTAWHYRHLYTLPDPVRSWLRFSGRRFQPMRDVSALVSVDPAERYVAMKNFPTIDWLRNLPGFAQWSRTFFPEEKRPAYLDFATYDLRRGIVDEHLHRYDLATMRESVELRTPFLTRSLADLMAEFDPRSLVAFGQKNVLLSLLSRYLPRHLYGRKKRGFTYPPRSFVERYGAQAPAVSGLSRTLVDEAWNRRFEAYGWTRLAARLVAAQTFLDAEQNRRALLTVH